MSPVCQGVDAAGLASAADRLREALAVPGPEMIRKHDQGLIPKLRLLPLTDTEK